MTRMALIRYAATTAAIGGLVLLLYLPGLDGAFLLDDFPNLAPIQQLPDSPSLSDYWQLLGAGNAGPLGRPLAMLTFLLQHESWPAAFDFKRVNLILHLLNGFLVGLVCSLILRSREVRVNWQWLTAGTALLWLAHPLQVSTVLYVVQHRGNQLSATFILGGIALYLVGRAMTLNQRPRAGAGLMALGAFGGGLLASLSKESGVLILAYLAILEFTLLPRPLPGSILHRARQLILLLLLALGLVAFCLYLPTLLPLYELKPFTLTQRTLTQFPVLLAYLGSLALLRPGSFGLFHDDFPLVQGLAASPWVIPCILAVIALLGLALAKRRQWPWLSFAILWFFAGHSLESTLLPMELYFEHRNYLPILGPLLALVVSLSTLVPQVTHHRRRLIMAACAGALLWMTLLTLGQTRLWGDPLAQARTAVQQHPGSYMAQSNLVTLLANSGRFQEAYEFHRATMATGNPGIAAHLRWLEFGCLLPGVELPGATALDQAARTSPHGYDVIQMLNNLVPGINGGACRGVPREPVRVTLQGLQENPSFRVSLPDLLQLQALLEAGAGNYVEAAQLAERSEALRPDERVSRLRQAWLDRAAELGAAPSASSPN